MMAACSLQLLLVAAIQWGHLLAACCLSLSSRCRDSDGHSVYHQRLEPSDFSVIMISTHLLLLTTKTVSEYKSYEGGDGLNLSTIQI